MARIAVELSAKSYEALQRIAKKAKRTPKAQAEWMLEDLIETEETYQEARKHPDSGAHGLELYEVSGEVATAQEFLLARDSDGKGVTL